MPYLSQWLLLILLGLTWAHMHRMRQWISKLEERLPLRDVYKCSIRFTNKLIDEHLKLTPEERAYFLEMVPEVSLTIEFWQSHIVIHHNLKTGAANPWSIYSPNHVRKNPVPVVSQRVAPGERPMFGTRDVPEIHLKLHVDALQMFAIYGRFGEVEYGEPKPENVFLTIPLNLEKLSPYKDDDPDAWRYTPRNISGFDNWKRVQEGREELTMWDVQHYFVESY